MRVRILGAGIIGLSVARELLGRGHDVEVVDPRPGSGASYAAAGMLAPAAELWHGEPEILGLGRRSLALWPAYAASLGVPLHTTGTLLVGLDAADRQEVDRQAALVEAAGGHPERLDRRALLDREPGLSPRASGGVLLAEDWSVDPRAVVAALRTQVPVVAEPTGPSATTVIATGSALPPQAGSVARLVRGVRGEILRLHSDDPPAHTLRGWVRGEPVYLVPRAGGEVVVGATSEEHDDPPVVTAGGVLRLLAAARELLPGLDRAELVDAVARDRPGTPDNLPLVGPAPDTDVVLAAGHFRHGVLLAPLTAQLVADHLETGAVEPALDPRRFAT